MPSQVIELCARTMPRVGSLQATFFAITSSLPSHFLLRLASHCLSTHRVEGLLISHHLGTEIIEGFILRPRGAQADFNISEGGDSGAVWFDPRTNEAVGLHFMGNSGFAPDAAYACFMPLVLRDLDVRLVPSEAGGE